MVGIPRALRDREAHRRGRSILGEHRESLEHIAAEHGVPPEYIVAIIGSRPATAASPAITAYSMHSQRSRSTIRRARNSFAASSSSSSCSCARNNLDPLTVKGSYAGAWARRSSCPPPTAATPSMPTRSAARPVDRLGRILASVANYLREHGWEAGGPVLVEARLEPDADFQIDPSNLDLNETARQPQRARRQDRSRCPRRDSRRAHLGRAAGRARLSGRLQEFPRASRAITRSARYAMAVNDLAQAIARADARARSPRDRARAGRSPVRACFVLASPRCSAARRSARRATPPSGPPPPQRPHPGAPAPPLT